MKRSVQIFLAMFLIFGSAWAGLIILPFIQVGKLGAFVTEDGESLPKNLSGLAQYGRTVYVANGCVYCHTQQVRSENLGTDLERGWGTRQSVARDYINDKTSLLGSMRTGPDLSNISKRRPNPAWLHQHLYHPQALVPNSVMPPFRFLYKQQKITGQASADALKLTASDTPPDGEEIVPTYEAKALVAYLLSLDQTYSLPEAPTK